MKQVTSLRLEKFIIKRLFEIQKDIMKHDPLSKITDRTKLIEKFIISGIKNYDRMLRRKNRR